jgi:hypothetical protein
MTSGPRQKHGRPTLYKHDISSYLQGYERAGLMSVIDGGLYELELYGLAYRCSRPDTENPMSCITTGNGMIIWMFGPW